MVFSSIALVQFLLLSAPQRTEKIDGALRGCGGQRFMALSVMLEQTMEIFWEIVRVIMKESEVIRILKVLKIYMKALLGANLFLSSKIR